MKYGETLRQRSIPAWSHHNIDYDDIKLFIKEQTTGGEGKSVSIPGRPDDKLLAFENSLFAILADQHLRIDLFVRSKAGEIKRRLEHSKKQLSQLYKRTSTTADRRIPVGRLERYGRLENDVLTAGEEIKSLARFTSTQRTAIRKLLKKYRKWTGSTHLEERFRDEVLDDPKGFTNLDLGSLLDDYSSTLKSVRSLYEERIQQTSVRGAAPERRSISTPVLAALQRSVDSGSKVEFDSAMVSIPLGNAGTMANYFIHPENVVEIQLLMLQYTAYFDNRSRANSVHSPISTATLSEAPILSTQEPDCHFLAADDLDRFSSEQNALTVNEREGAVGALPQRAKYCVRWTNEDDARIAVRESSSRMHCAKIKSKHVEAFFDMDGELPPKVSAELDASVLKVRRDIEKSDKVRPLYMVSSGRSRFAGFGNDASNVLLATLDTGLTFEPHKTAGASTTTKSTFPFAVLAVRQEGPASGALINALDHSHLAERVRGFSIEYHAAWQVCKSASIPPPAWATVLSDDIRKLPPPAIARKRSAAGTSSDTRTQGSFSNSSEPNATDSATVVESASTIQQSDLESLPIRSFRRKRRRGYPAEAAAPHQQQRYWSEYDHPEDGEDESDAYVLYIDPNEKSSFDRLLEKFRHFFRPSHVEEQAALLTSPILRDDDDTTTTSSDEEDITGSSTRRPRATTYGTLSRQLPTTNILPTLNLRDPELALRHPSTPTAATAPHTTTICLIASLIILSVAFLLAFTGRHRYATAVDSGVLFATASSLLFAVLGFASLVRGRRVPWVPWLAALGALVLDAAGCAWLIAYMLG